MTTTVAPEDRTLFAFRTAPSIKVGLSVIEITISGVVEDAKFCRDGRAP